MNEAAGRRLIVCADGTWNEVEKHEANRFVSTNVAKLASALAPTDSDGRQQILCYLEGVGTHEEERVGGGAFGAGLSENIRRAYAFLEETYLPGDTLHFFGFSRGAYTVRSLAGMLANCGLLRRRAKATVRDALALYQSRDPLTATDSVRAGVFRNLHSREVEIEFIGVWDTVGALGLPLIGVSLARHLGWSWEFHDVCLGPHIRHACQALAIHEQRTKFVPSIWLKPRNRLNQTLEQVWFSGAHADVGGGYIDSGLSDIALKWMIDSAKDIKRGGLRFRDDWQERCACAPNPSGQRHTEFKGVFRWLDSIFFHKPNGTLREFGAINTAESESCESIHSSVLQRYRDGGDDFWPSTFNYALS